MGSTHCAVTHCKMTMYNKPPGVAFHSCPTSNEMKNKWLLMLKNKCTILDWAKSKICSKHFENKYFDSSRRLKDSAIPTLFPSGSVIKSQKAEFTLKSKQTSDPKSKIDKSLNRQTQVDLLFDIRNTINKLKQPQNLDSFVNDNLKCKNDAPKEAQLWLLIKKQDHLISRLMEQITHNKKNVEILKKNTDAAKASKKEMEQSLETMKYVIKSLQEKHATLEEQVEILTAVESR